jgi:hypothetical protein
MANEVENLAVIGTRLVFFADGLFALAATIDGRLDEAKDEESKKTSELLSTTLNIVGAWAQLFGDYILFKAAQLDFENNMNSGESFDDKAGRLEVFVAGSQVALDVLEVQLAERAAVVVR